MMNRHASRSPGSSRTSATCGQGRLTQKKIGFAFGSHGGHGGAGDQITGDLKTTGIEVVEGGMEVYFKPDTDEREACYQAGLALAKQVTQIYISIGGTCTPLTSGGTSRPPYPGIIILPPSPWGNISWCTFQKFPGSILRTPSRPSSSSR
ncbi:hypothetical protein J2129_001914 [Methanofollis sp. W23]|uniref:hypothetical protein n=1 Tax=Methanofollis sp. W23 TaxID=2817849 RepID=UPI001AE93B32|nr:hypothetical protein [Methanofollis sp. W23]MBP2146460.1 hypothetical protein [Methanofollis sp. W23]